MSTYSTQTQPNTGVNREWTETHARLNTSAERKERKEKGLFLPKTGNKAEVSGNVI